MKKALLQTTIVQLFRRGWLAVLLTALLLVCIVDCMAAPANSIDDLFSRTMALSERTH